MYKLQITPTYWIGCLLFLFLGSHLIDGWTATENIWIYSVIIITKIVTSSLAAALIGVHLGKIPHQQRNLSLLFSLAIVYLLLQLSSYPFQNIIDSSSAMLWCIPQSSGFFVAAAFITLGFNLLTNIKGWKSYLASGLLLGLIAVFSLQQNLPQLIYLTISTAIGYFVCIKRDKYCTSLITTIGKHPTPWFYICLALIPILSSWSPPFSASTNLSTKYLICLLTSFCILLTAASSPGSMLFQWLTRWMGWISGNKILADYRATINIDLWDRLFQQHYVSALFSTLTIFFRTTLIISLVLLIFELPIRDWSLTNVIIWIKASPIYVVISALTFFILYAVLRVLLSRVSAALLLLVFASIASYTNTLKLLYLGVPLIPSDLNLINQAFDSLIFIVGKFTALLIYSSLFLFFSLFSFLTWRHSEIFLNRSLWIGLRGITGFLLAIWLLESPKKLLQDHIPNAWNSGNTTGLYAHVGIVSGFVFRYQQFYIDSPKGFSAQSIFSLASSLKINLPDQAANKTNMPHIIAIQSEAFWDPGNLHTDLYPHGSPGDLSVLCNNTTRPNTYCRTGSVEVPVFGGSTANSEFEFLTGLSMHLLPPGTVPFVHYIQKPIPSIGWQLKQANYQTLGIHPNGGWFWNRDKVYPLLGFEEFLDISAFENAATNQLYVTDQAINQLIEQRINNAKQPQFIFAITMANHAPFADERYSSLNNEPIDWEQLPTLTAEEQQAIKTYSIGARESRHALEELIDTYSKENTPPVIIVFYGDHLPILGENYSIYHKAGFKVETMTDQFREFYSTPYLVWSNQNLSRPLATSMTVSLLGQEIIDLAGLGSNGLQQVITQLQDTPLLRKATRTQILNNEKRAPLTQQQESLATLYRFANFDALFHQTALPFYGLQQPLTVNHSTNLDE
ncbi:MAG: LTA synthase family protein [Cellvibrio sp.]|uniref:LTA synthase family protein n=1 Tax=Cellvibrio sp. TaxID=1965322 RepID=UPI00272554C6|nr:LTA synthase family protein [Cellvibrio sp.]